MAFVYMYSPPPFHTTYVDPTFPEHHLPFERTRHRIGSAISDINPFSSEKMEHIFTPHSDIRETSKKYYIDIELPGLTPKDPLEVRWIDNEKAVIVDATIKRPEIDEGEPAEATKGESTEAKKDAAEEKSEHPVHILAHERRVGRFVRSFDFNGEVNHETMDVRIGNGLLRIVLEKAPRKEKMTKTVEVQRTEESHA